MANLSTKPARANVVSPVRTTAVPAPTYQGGQGYRRDSKSELFLLAISLLLGERTYYEAAEERKNRLRYLAHEVVGQDAEWVARFVPYLRNVMQIRTASVAVACEYVKAGGPNGRAVIDSACARADEPAEVLAYWHQEYGRKVPMAVKRGVADAVRRLYNEKSVLKYDGQSRAWRMGDVVELVHPKPKAEWQNALFRYLLNVRHHPDNARIEGLPIVQAVREWQANPTLELPEGVTWERLSGTRQMDAQAWESVIPQMGYMALLRNLRNFDETGISQAAVNQVIARLTDAEQVAKSRQFPIRFLSAIKELSSLRWSQALETALQHSLQNVPALGGKTLIMVDVSDSMFGGWGNRSKVQNADIACVFGAALALRAESPTLVAYSSDGVGLDVPKGGSALMLANACQNWPGARGGTNTGGILAQAEAQGGPYDRVVILTDEQHRGIVQTNAPLVYTFNIAGYVPAQMEQGEKGRYAFGGLTDAGFRVIELLESQREGAWPF